MKGRVPALRAAIAALVDGVDVGAVVEQPCRHLDVTFRRGQVQQRLALEARVEIGAAGGEHVQDGQRVGGDLYRVVNDVAALPGIASGAGNVVGP